MLLSIFIFIIAFSLLLIIIGKYTDAPVGSIAGAGVMFIAGIILMFSTIEYQSGTNTEVFYQYGDNFSNNPHWDEYTPGDAPSFTPADDAVFLFHTFTNETIVYNTWDEEEILSIKTRHMIAFTILVTAILLFVSILSNLREGGDLDDE